MSVEQELREKEDRECAQAAKDARIDNMTTDALSRLTEVELYNALTEVSIESCDGSAEAGEAERR